MHAISDNAVSQQGLSAPSNRAGDTVLSVASTTGSLGASGGNLAYAGYPYDPFVDTVTL